MSKKKKNRIINNQEYNNPFIKLRDTLTEELKTESLDFSDSSVRKKLEKDFYKSCEEIARMNSKEARIKAFVDLSDCSKVHLERRTKAVSEYAEYVQERFASKYPDLSVVKEFLSVNSPHSGLTYNAVCGVHNITYAIALWMLDKLSRGFFLVKATQYFPPDELLEDIILPGYADCCFSERQIKGMIYLIEHRNSADNHERKHSVFIDDAAPRYYGERRYQITDPETEGITDRQKFDSVMAMIPKAVRDRALQRFVEKEWEALDLCFSCMYPFRQTEIRLLKELIKQQEIIENIRFEMDKIRNQPTGVPLSVERIRDNEKDRFMKVAELHEKVEEYMDVCLSLDEQKSEATANKESIAITATISRQYLNSDEGILDIEIARKLNSLEVKNPYETAFALLLLIDSGNNMAWLYNQGIMVIQAAAKKLPWALANVPEWERGWEDPFEDYEEEPDREDEEVPEPNPETDKSPDLQEYLDNLEPIDWIDEEEKLYAQIYDDRFLWRDPDDVSEDDLKPMNLPQVIFEETGVVMPRNVSDEMDMAELLEKSGFDAMEAKLMERVFTMSHAVWTKDNSDVRTKSDDANEKDKEDDGKLEAILADAGDLKAQVSLLKERLKERHNERNQLAKKVEALEDRNKKLENEIEELRSMIRKAPVGKEEEEKIPEVVFPYSAVGRYVVFGGHDSWSKAIKPLLQNVRFVDANAKPDVRLVKYADAVWIQNNAISHSAYYKIMDTVRTHDIPVQYFSFASAEKCAEQLALFDMRNCHET